MAADVLTEAEKLLVTKVTLMGAVIEEFNYGHNLTMFKCSGAGAEIWGATDVGAARGWLERMGLQGLVVST